MPTSSEEEPVYKFKGGKIPKISYLLSEGLIKIKKENNYFSFEDHTDLVFKTSVVENKKKPSHILITCTDSEETYTYQL